MAIEFNPESSSIRKIENGNAPSKSKSTPNVIFSNSDKDMAVKIKELVKSVNKKALKAKGGEINGPELAKMFGQIGYNDQETRDVARMNALELVLDSTFGVLASKEHSVTNTYALQDGSIIIYNRGENITIQNKKGEIKSYDLKGNPMDKIPNIDKANIYFVQQEMLPKS